MAARGGRRGGGASTSRQIATALGIPMNEMAAFMRNKGTAEPPPKYPQIQRSLIPLEITNEINYMADFKAEFKTRLMESPFFLDEEEDTNEEKRADVRRYTDKYKIIQREKFTPDFARLPDELCYMKKRKKRKEDGTPQKKRKKLADDADSKTITAKLASLEEKEKKSEHEEPEEEEEEEEDSDAEKAVAEGVAGESEDEGEEENDYISSYFDNGEGYGDGGSDDNLDEDGVF